MKKRKRTERVEPWRTRLHSGEAKALGERLGDWMSRAVLEFPDDMPVEDRAADVWEALVIVSEAAGGEWRHRAWNAASATQLSDVKASIGVHLLRDLRAIFGSNNKLSTEVLLQELWKVTESEWSRYHASGDAMNARDLSKVLRPYGASPQDIWIGRRTVKGYCADELQDAWDRYLPQS